MHASPSPLKVYPIVCRHLLTLTSWSTANVYRWCYARHVFARTARIQRIKFETMQQRQIRRLPVHILCIGRLHKKQLAFSTRSTCEITFLPKCTCRAFWNSDVKFFNFGQTQLRPTQIASPILMNAHGCPVFICCCWGEVDLFKLIIWALLSIVINAGLVEWWAWEWGICNAHRLKHYTKESYGHVNKQCIVVCVLQFMCTLRVANIYHSRFTFMLRNHYCEDNWADAMIAFNKRRCKIYKCMTTTQMSNE